MSRIQVLPPALINQIAAGEVVERPASVVKELMENSLDAGASRITVEVEGGGLERICVADDGCGLLPEDALLALERHATSKIRTFEDLTAVLSLGFRGEALPSIASVSRLTLTTSPDDSGLGTEVSAVNGAPPVSRPMRFPKGTRIVVEELFANVPARRKFMKSPEAELKAIVRAFNTLALSRTGVSFVLFARGRTVGDYSAQSTLSDRLVEIVGAHVLKKPVPIDFAFEGMKVTGVISPPESTFASRTYQWTFLNGRAIKDGTVSHALSLAVKDVMRDERHPAVALFITADPGVCDVNVHPQKLEVRFKQPNTIHSLVHRGVASALGSGKGSVSAGGGAFTLRRVEPFRPPEPRPSRDAMADFVKETVRSGDVPVERFKQAALVVSPAVSLPPIAYREGTETSSPVGRLRLIGQYRDSFLLADGEEGLVLIDQHVAHERVRYERILDQISTSSVPSQQLLLPVSFEATPEEALLLERAEELLSRAGFSVSGLSGRVFLITAAPVDCPAGQIERVLRDFLDKFADLPDGADPKLSEKRFEAIAASMACRGAITVNTRIRPEEAARLLADLTLCRDPYTCPHGRPIILTFTHTELEKRFKRRS